MKYLQKLLHIFVILALIFNETLNNKKYGTFIYIFFIVSAVYIFSINRKLLKSDFKLRENIKDKLRKIVLRIKNGNKWEKNYDKKEKKLDKDSKNKDFFYKIKNFTIGFIIGAIPILLMIFTIKPSELNYGIISVIFLMIYYHGIKIFLVTIYTILPFLLVWGAISKKLALVIGIATPYMGLFIWLLNNKQYLK